MSPRKLESWLFGKWGPLEKSLAAWTKDVLWPEGACCCACGRVTDGTALCAACRESFLHDGYFWAWERSDPEPGLPAWSLRPHEGVPRELVIRLKYGAESRAARLLSELLLPLPEGVSFPPDTVVTWVTMPESRRRDRGIDHGRLLAEAFADAKAPDAPRAELQETLKRFRKGSRFLPYCTGKEKLQVSLVSRSPALYNRLFQNRARRALKQKLGISAQTP